MPRPIHSLIRTKGGRKFPRGTPATTVSPCFAHRRRGAAPVIIEECSDGSPTGRLGRPDALRHAIWCCRSGQLPRSRAAVFPPKAEPVFLLTRSIRQAATTPIHRLAMQCARSAIIAWLMHRQVSGKHDVRPRLVLEAIGIVGTTARPRSATPALASSRFTRSLSGPRTVGVRNIHQGLLNARLGRSGTLVKETVSRVKLLVRLKMTTESPGSAPRSSLPRSAFREPPKSLSLRQESYGDFDSATALTVHKRRRLEWNSVVLFDESLPGQRERWLVTGIDRARERAGIGRR